MMLKVARPEASCLELSLQHGYMRCYAPAFSRNKTFMRELEKLAEKLPKLPRKLGTESVKTLFSKTLFFLNLFFVNAFS